MAIQEQTKYAIIQIITYTDAKKQQEQQKAPNAKTQISETKTPTKRIKRIPNEPPAKQKTTKTKQTNQKQRQRIKNQNPIPNKTLTAQTQTAQN